MTLMSIPHTIFTQSWAAIWALPLEIWLILLVLPLIGPAIYILWDKTGDDEKAMAQQRALRSRLNMTPLALPLHTSPEELLTLHVEVEQDSELVEVSVDLSGWLTQEVSFWYEKTPGERVDRPATGPTLTHDPRFDRLFRAHGEPWRVHTMLTKEARQQLLALIEPRAHGKWNEISFKQGVLTAWLKRKSAPGSVHAHHLSLLVQDVIHAAHAISPTDHESIPERLLQELQKTQSNPYRAQCMHHMLARWPKAPATQDAIARCRRHPVCELQLVIFEHSPHDFGAQERYQLMLDTSERHTDEARRLGALEVLARDYADAILLEPNLALFQRLRIFEPLLRLSPPALTQDLITEAIEHASSRERREYFAQLAELGWRAPAALLTREVAIIHKDAETTLALCDLIALQPALTRQKLSVRLLHHQRHHAVRMRAVQQLAICGDASTLPLLVELCQTTQTSQQHILSSMASQAILIIQERLGMHAHGQLTLVDPHDHAGKLSLSTQAGALTQLDDPSHG